jgi:hypothetical protein
MLEACQYRGWVCAGCCGYSRELDGERVLKAEKGVLESNGGMCERGVWEEEVK